MPRTRLKENETKVKEEKLFNDFWQKFVKGKGIDGANLPTGTKERVRADFMNKIASSAETRKKMRQVASMTPQQAAKLGDYMFNLDASGLEDEISDEEAARHAGVTGEVGEEPVPSTPENLPAVVNDAISAHTGVIPEWHMVKHLPGYLKSSIRAVGRQVFSPMTNTSIEDIQVLADLGNGPNTTQELRAVANWLNTEGERVSDIEIHFEKIFPGYDAQIVAYNALGFTYIVVKDFMGHYIYSWPQSENKIGATPARKLK